MQVWTKQFHELCQYEKVSHIYTINNWVGNILLWPTKKIYNLHCSSAEQLYEMEQKLILQIENWGWEGNESMLEQKMEPGSKFNRKSAESNR